MLCVSGEMKGCGEGMSEQESIDEVYGRTGCGIEPADASNELTELLTMTIELDEPDCSVIPCMYLGGMQMQLGHVNGLGDRVDASGVQMDAPSVSNKAETDVMGHREGAGMYLATGDVKHVVYKPDGCGNLAEGLTGHTDTHSDGDESETSENKSRNVRTCQIRWKTENSPNATKIVTPKPADQWK